MHVEVRHFLPAMRADIGEQAIAGFDRARFARDMADRADETGDLRYQAGGRATFGDPLQGARILSVLCAAATMGMFWGAARSLRVPWPALWAVGLLALAPEMTYRLTYTRPFVLAVGLALRLLAPALARTRSLGAHFRVDSAADDNIRQGIETAAYGEIA